MIRKSLAFMILAFMLVLSAAGSAYTETVYDASTMRLLRYEGDLQILDPSGESRFVMENVRFASGEEMLTGLDSHASVSLDTGRIVTLDEMTRVGFVQESDHLRMSLKEGTLFLDVSEKLDGNESLDIETATMTVGIRGTIVYLRQEAGTADTEEQALTVLGVLEGTAQIDYTDVTGSHRLMPVQAGMKAEIRAASPGSVGVNPSISPMIYGDLSDFATNLILEDEQLTRRVIDGSENGASLLYPSAGVTGPAEDDFTANGNWTWADPVTLVAQSASKFYDGLPLTRPGDVLVSGLPEGFHIQVTASGSQTDAGSTENRIAGFEILDAAGKNVTSHFSNIQKVSGRLQVDPAPLTVWTGSARKAYDGRPLTNPEAEIRTVPGHERGEPAWRNTSLVSRTALGSETMIGVSGHTWVHAANPLTGETEEVVLSAGQQLLVLLDTREGEEAFALQVVNLKAEELPDEVLRMYADNPALMTMACKDTGWDAGLLSTRISQLSPSAGEAAVASGGLKVPGSLSEDVLTDSADVRITVDSDIINYNGRPLNGNEAHFTPIVLDPSIEVKATGSRTEVGSSVNTYTISWGNANPENYVLTEDLGTLTVTSSVYRGTVTLTGASASKAYDGAPLRDDGFDVRGLPAGYSVTATVEGEITDAGTAENRITSYQILNGRGQDAGADIPNVQLLSGTLTVSPAPLTVSTPSASKAYDGTPLTAGPAVVSGLVAGETILVEVTGAITEPGTAENACIINWGQVNSLNYALTVNPGTLTVTANDAEIVLTAASDSKTYDGTALANAGVTVAGVPEGFTCTAAAGGSQKDAGSSPNSVAEYAITDGGGADRTACFSNITTVDGTLTVTPKEATVSTGGGTKEYDGKPFTVPEAIMDGLVEGESVTLTATGTITDVGTADNTFSVIWDGAKEGNYTLSLNLGKLEVTENTSSVTLTAGSTSKVYDGQALTFPDVSSAGLPEGFTCEAAAGGSQTDVGSSENPVGDGYRILDGDGQDRTSFFSNITCEAGTLTVTPRAVTVTTGSASKAYDGTALTNPSVTVENLAEGESVTLKATGAVTELGSADNTYSIKWDQAKAENYTVTDALGVLEVTKNETEIVITSDSYTAEYWPGGLTRHQYSVQGLPPALTVDVEISGYQYAAGSSPNTIDSYTIKNADGEDRTANFTKVTTVEGTLTVTKAKIDVWSTNDTVTYDGQWHYAHCYWQGAYQADNPPTQVHISGYEAVKDAGTYTPGFSVTIREDLTDRYELGTITFGTLKIEPATLTVTTGSAEKTYDGSPLTAEGGVEIDGLVAGEEIDVTCTGSQTDAGEGQNTFTIEWTEAKETNYNLVPKPGALTVTPKPLTVTSLSDSKLYDGEPLVCHEWTSSGLVEGEGISVSFTGSQTEPGVGDNTFTIVWDHATEGNYSVTTEFGTLTVTAESGG